MCKKKSTSLFRDAADEGYEVTVLNGYEKTLF